MTQDRCEQTHKLWKKTLGTDGECFGLEIEVLSDEMMKSASDLDKIARADIVITTAKKWELLSRNEVMLEKIDLFLVDQVHMMNELRGDSKQLQDGVVMETLLTRIRNHKAKSMQQGLKPARLVLMSNPIATSKDICNWLGIDFENCCFNYSPTERSNLEDLGRMQLNLQSFDSNSPKLRYKQMIKPLVAHVRQALLENDRCLILVRQKKVQPLLLEILQ